jgi:hypothetical protein
MIDYAQARRMMVDCQLRTFDVNDNAVLDAFDTVPRETFVPQGREPFAYIDQTLHLAGANGEVRCLPAPMVLARMIQALKIRPGAKALDIGTGTGYAVAVMAHLGAQVTALESVPDLAEKARAKLGSSIQVIEGPLQVGAASPAFLVRTATRRRPCSCAPATPSARARFSTPRCRSSTPSRPKSGSRSEAARRVRVRAVFRAARAAAVSVAKTFRVTRDR